MNILVVGFYHNQNLGDEMFIEAFKYIWPQYNFTFVNWITKELLTKFNVVIFGGGSFLDGMPFVASDAMDDLRKKTILYLSIGAETDIHPDHKELLALAKLISIRTPEHRNKIKSINPNTIVSPDIVYGLPSKTKINRLKKSILICNNISTIPQYFDEHWRFAAWDRFKLELAQVLDDLIDDGYMIRFMPMSIHQALDDRWASQEVISMMKHRGSNYWATSCKTYNDAINLINDYELVITQRFHGAVLAEATMTPYISIAHHDKLTTSWFKTGNVISYYEVSKKSIKDAIKTSQKQIINVINPDIFKDIKQKVIDILDTECNASPPLKMIE